MSITDFGHEETVEQNTAAHEAGHMFGLGDEYVEEKPGANVTPKFFADELADVSEIS